MMPQITVNAIAAILEGVASSVRKFGVAVRNRCPWVSYINQAGKVCSHFIARAKFSGYHFKFNKGTAIVTNLETGKQYTVSLTTPYCDCKSFKFSPFPKQPCKHMKMVAELRGDLEQVVAQSELDQHIEQQAKTVAPCIDEKDLPKGCTLDRTEDWASLEYRVYVHVIARDKGVPQHDTKCIGRIVQGMSGISAYRLRSGVYKSFARTMDAVKYLVCSSDYSLKEVAEAFDRWDELALDF